jgi:very-long-chain (3R)-3-hydroxyacyl-CoA dehydratase
VNAYPRATSTSPFYSSMLVAWAVSEIVRYSYFVLNLRRVNNDRQGAPALLTWLRYNLFYVLYPLGIGSEVVLLWKATEVAEKKWQWAFLAILLAYVPGEL